MNYKIDYLLKYVSNDTYKKIKNSNNDYLLSSLEHSRIDVDLNIRYLIKYGINNINSVIYERLEDLIMTHNEFIDMINKYEDSMGKDSFISMYENI
ncbi:MAG: hypothetical protein VZS44_04000 [Bacilli bacterium]|nr:hypothetical protein [Bacilli bacterium]